MNDNQKRFFDLVKQFEGLKEQLKTVGDQLDSVMLELGLDTYHQDESTGLVYKVYKPDGTFTAYRDVAFKRTAKEGERGGQILSKKEAEEQGFVLRK